MNIDAISAKAQIRIRKSPPEVFSAFAEAEPMSKFWFTRNDDGLKASEIVPWFIGIGEEAVSFPVLVTELNPRTKLSSSGSDRTAFRRGSPGLFKNPPPGI